MVDASATLGADEASFHRFHQVDLPARFAAGNGLLAHSAVAHLADRLGT